MHIQHSVKLIITGHWSPINIISYSSHMTLNIFIRVPNTTHQRTWHYICIFNTLLCGVCLLATSVSSVLHFCEETEVAFKNAKLPIHSHTANTTLTNIILQAGKHHIPKGKMLKACKTHHEPKINTIPFQTNFPYTAQNRYLEGIDELGNKRPTQTQNNTIILYEKTILQIHISQTTL